MNNIISVRIERANDSYKLSIEHLDEIGQSIFDVTEHPSMLDAINYLLTLQQ